MKITLPMPPSDNNIYFNWGRARKRTSAADKYHNQVQEAMAHLALGGCEEFEDQVPYSITIIVYFEEVLTKGWPKWAKNRFLKTDCMNRQKLVTDAVMECIGIDDRHIFDSRVIKRRDRENPRVEVILRRM
jgi:Holliday junction resolvase RusA-like endonuclease